MLESLQLILMWALISVCTGSFVVYVFFHNRLNDFKGTKPLAVLSATIATVLLLVRIIATKGLPFASGLDFGFWLNALLLLGLCFAVLKLSFPVAGCIIYPIVIGISIWMTSFNLAQQPEAPALRSYWLDFHVSAAIVAYVGFMLSFVFSMMLLVGKKKHIDKLPHAETLSEWAYRASLVGLTFQTVMLITGSVWAEYAWGSYWSWDPKETWALITWFIYAIYLHLRLRGWSETKLAWVSVLGFACVIFTFFGVSYLLPGLHSYI